MAQRARKWSPTPDPSVTVAEERGVRSLHIGGQAIQSAMRLSSPDQLELHYTRAMMSFLLFHPSPRRVLMIGLGGGSMAKFMHRHLSGAHLTVVEIRPEVVAAARAFFELPKNDERLDVVVADGAQYVPAHPARCDVLLLDGFEDGKQPMSLCSQPFYDAAWESLRPGGVLAVNFMAFDPKLDVFLQRIEKSFRGRVVLVDAADRVNVIALGFREGPDKVAWSELRGRAQALKAMLGLPFDRFITLMRERNRHTARHLQIAPEQEAPPEPRAARRRRRCTGKADEKT
jgi:spermidine synthase